MRTINLRWRWCTVHTLGIFVHFQINNRQLKIINTCMLLIHAVYARNIQLIRTYLQLILLKYFSTRNRNFWFLLPVELRCFVSLNFVTCCRVCSALPYFSLSEVKPILYYKCGTDYMANFLVSQRNFQDLICLQPNGTPWSYDAVSLRPLPRQMIVQCAESYKAQSSLRSAEIQSQSKLIFAFTCAFRYAACQYSSCKRALSK